MSSFSEITIVPSTCCPPPPQIAPSLLLRHSSLSSSSAHPAHVVRGGEESIFQCGGVFLSASSSPELHWADRQRQKGLNIHQTCDMMDITVVIVSSPVISNPDTYIIDTVIDSLDLIDGLEKVKILIILDGYLISDKSQTKKGRITYEMKVRYEEYFVRLKEKYTCSRFEFHKNSIHLGFALSVKHGLELCRSKYALVLQHDRKFVYPFSGIPALIQCMEINEHIRYVHFPTVMSIKHTSSLRRYGLHQLADAASMHIPISKAYELRPLIFWYDSNHLCHVGRYLEIYSPYRAMPTTIRDIVDGVDSHALRKMLIRRGDFIEDKFGQVQRNVLVSLKGDSRAAVEVFLWFGCYVLWHDDGAENFASSKNDPANDDVNISEGNSMNCVGNFTVVRPQAEGNGDTAEYSEPVTHQTARDRRATHEVAQSTPFTTSTFHQVLSNRSCIMVSHLRGRHYDPSYATAQSTTNVGSTIAIGEVGECEI